MPTLQLSFQTYFYPPRNNLYYYIKLNLKKIKAPVNKGDIVVTTGGFPNTSENRTTNLMKIEEIK